MSVAVAEVFGTVTPSSGTASVNIANCFGIINQVIVTPTTATTTFDVAITNQKSRDIYDMDDSTGFLVDKIDVALRNDATLTITNASVDESFEYYVSIVERYA